MSQKSKNCTKCGIKKTLENFHQHKSGKRKGKIWSECKDCRKKRLYQWRKDNPEKYAENNLKGRLKYKYGLTVDEVKVQGICPICDKDKRLVIDHCHLTKNVRGFICYNCNTLLGHIENKDKMRAVEDYLKGYRTNYHKAYKS